MECIAGWKLEEDRLKRPPLSDNPEQNTILRLGSDGYLVEEIQRILTEHRPGDQGIRDMWNIGNGDGKKWTANQVKEAYNVSLHSFRNCTLPNQVLGHLELLQSRY